ncbi:MAG: DUF4339 domain-containing protein [Akkermansia sp.]|nr:DUF4339 domain-containing protein [Akkermansia sp.]
MKFYYTDGENLEGPKTQEELATEYFNGTLSAETQICQEGTDYWIPITCLLQPAKKLPKPPVSSTHPTAAHTPVTTDVASHIDIDPEIVPMASPNIAQIFTCLLLAFISILLVVQLSKLEPPAPPAQYEYASMRITTEDLLNCDMVRGFHDLGLVHCEKVMGIPSGWEYVSTLCPDGDKAAYILMRRLKIEKKKSKINS